MNKKIDFIYLVKKTSDLWQKLAVLGFLGVMMMFWANAFRMVNHQWILKISLFQKVKNYRNKKE